VRRNETRIEEKHWSYLYLHVRWPLEVVHHATWEKIIFPLTSSCARGLGTVVNILEARIHHPIILRSLYYFY